MNEKMHSLNWFEIPANNIDRATKFYENIFDIKMKAEEIMGMKMAFFPSDIMTNMVSGGLVESPDHKPSNEGALIYLNANPDLSVALDRIEKAGGKIVMPKTEITPEIGHMAFFIDSEGNKVGLHSNN